MKQFLKSLKNLASSFENTTTVQFNSCTINGESNLEIKNGKIFVDGKPLDHIINITIESPKIQELNITYANTVSIKGDVNSYECASADTEVTGNVQNIESMSGDIAVTGDVLGKISTMSGDVSINKKG